MTVGAVSRCSADTLDNPVLHRTVRNYSGEAILETEGDKFGVDLLGAPDTI
jgi:hypothetical protein